MGDPREPPEGTPEGGSNDDEFRSVVFDESFVKAARIQELSAQERLAGAFGRATRRRGWGWFGSLPRQAVILLLLVTMAFAAAVYFGISSPHGQVVPPSGTQLTAAVTPLSPPGTVGAVPDPAHPFAALPPGYADGQAGLGMPPASPTSHFAVTDVQRALDSVQHYLVVSELTPATLTANETGQVRELLTSGELAQYDASVNTPRDDQQHAATGWMVRFDPGQIALATDTVKVTGAVQVGEVDSGTLEITADHTLVYALRPAGTTSDPSVTLYAVRREVRIDVDRADLDAGRVRVVDSTVQAGPTSCGTVQSDYLQPTLATASGVQPSTPPAVNPTDHSRPAWQTCGVLGPITR
ncbi:SCO2583 family membrane protein [Kitasatospora griseola]|uniref:SCO2583 family membrane protein n=1 Tax=Kitasatospora griseola TaxID=2064 RepID=UPI003666B69B